MEIKTPPARADPTCLHFLLLLQLDLIVASLEGNCCRKPMMCCNDQSLDPSLFLLVYYYGSPKPSSY